MGSFSFRMPAFGVPSEFFDQIPRSSRVFIRRGFDALALVQTQYQELLASMVLESVVTGQSPNAEDISSKFGVSTSDAPKVATAIGFLTLVLSAPMEPEPIPDTIEALIKAEIIDSSVR